MSRMRMFDYLEHHRALQSKIDAALRRVIGSGSLILGPEVAAFEREFAAFLGAGTADTTAGPGRGVGVGNGTDAIAIALRALHVGAGDEVVTVSNTAVPTVSAIREVGAVPVFCDVDARTCLLDLERIEACLTERTKAVIPVHLFGNVVDIPRLQEIVAGRGVAIVEDCAQAHGALLSGTMVGTMGDVGAFSFYPTKNLGAYGDGGFCLARDPALAERIRSLRTYGFEGRYYAEHEGVNSRLDEIQAAILRVKLRHLPRQLERRRVLAAAYDGHLHSRVRWVTESANARHAYHLYVVRVGERDRIRAGLETAGIPSAIHYPYPIHTMRAYAHLGYRAGSLPVTESLAGEILSLPLYPELPPADVHRVCEVLNRLVQEN